MELIDKINKKLKVKKVELTAITTAISILATGILPGLSMHNEEENLKTETEVVKVFTDEILDVKQEEYNTKNEEKFTKKFSVNIGNYNGNSIVEALEKVGYDSSFKMRKKLAKQYGVKKYDKSEEKNNELLNALKKEAKRIKTHRKKGVHKYKLVKNIKYKNNENDTHTVIKRYKCTVCGKSKTKKIEKDHRFDNEIVVIDDEFEIHTCLCGEKEFVRHDYGEWIDNKDGLTEGCVCKNCGHQKMRIKSVPLEDLVEGVDYIKTLVYTDNGDNTHSLATKYKWINASGSLTIITKGAHDEYGVWESLDDKEEIRRCACGHEEKRKHDYGVAKEIGNGMESLTCKKCSHVMLRPKRQVIIPSSPIITPSTPTVPSKPTIPNNPVEEHTHEFVKIDEKITINADGTHTITTIYECAKDKKQKIETKTEACNYEKTIEQLPGNTNKHLEINTCSVCKDIKKEEKDCNTSENILTEVVDGVVYQYRECDDCHGKVDYEEHKSHTDAPLDLEYVFDHANGDGTHELTGKYNCDICHEEVLLHKTESCDYSKSEKTYEQIPGGNFTVTNTHNVSQTCDVCGETKTEKEACTPTGDMNYMIFGAQTYEFYYCENCGYRCEQVPHFEHNYKPWEPKDEKVHKKECPCYTSINDGDRELTETHHMVFKDGSLVCDVCSYTKENVSEHKHAVDEMDLMDLLDYFNQLMSYSQIMNPDPAADKYCSRYDIHCSECGAYYTIYQSHIEKESSNACGRNGCPIKNLHPEEENINLTDYVEALSTNDLVSPDLSDVSEEEAIVITPGSIQAKKLIKTR